MRVVRAVGELLAPAALVVASALLGATFARSTEIYFINALVMVSIVVALYVFVGNSGVLSFGHISFFALGVWGAGVLSIPEQEKPATMPYLFDFLSSTTVGNVPSLVIAALVGGVFALLVGLPLAPVRARGRDRDLRGPRDHEQHPPLLREGRAGTEHVLVRSRDDRPPPGRGGRTPRDRRSLRVSTQPLRPAVAGRARGPGRGEAVGVSIYRQRLGAFALSGLLAGFAGGLYVHFLPINVDAVYLDLTFITLAMLVIGGATSLWGAVVGALAVSGLDSVLANAENGIAVLGRTVDVPAGTRIVVVSALMALVLVLRPSGLTGGRELSLEPLLQRFGPPAKGVAE